jgi:hypothetical protein
LAIILELAHGGDVGTYVKKHNGPLSIPEVNSNIIMIINMLVPVK